DGGADAVGGVAQEVREDETAAGAGEPRIAARGGGGFGVEAGRDRRGAERQALRSGEDDGGVEQVGGRGAAGECDRVERRAGVLREPLAFRRDRREDGAARDGV